MKFVSDILHTRTEYIIKQNRYNFTLLIAFIIVGILLIIFRSDALSAWLQDPHEESKIYLPLISNQINFESATWKLERVDSPRSFTYWDWDGRSISIDSKGIIHIVYGDDQLVHAKYDGVEWRFENVDSSFYTGSPTSITVDSSDNLHVSYYDGLTLDLKYAYFEHATSTWKLEVVDRLNDVGKPSSIAVGNDGTVHISYLDVTKKNLKYAKRINNSWTVSVVDPASGTGRSSSISVDSQNNPHIVYEDEINRRPKYAKWNNNNWEIQPITNTGYGGSVSLVLDSQDSPHFVNEGTAGLYYVTNENGKWKNISIEGGGRMGGRNGRLSLDSEGKPHVFYQYGGLLEFQFTYAVLEGTSWTFEVVDECRGGARSSLVLDTNNNPHIVYLKSCSGPEGEETPSGTEYLRYATRKSGNWEIHKIDRSNEVGQYLEMQVDSQGSSHFIYKDNLSGQPRYTALLNGKLTTETLSFIPPLPIDQELDSFSFDGAKIDINSVNEPQFIFKGGYTVYSITERDFISYRTLSYVSKKSSPNWVIQNIYSDTAIVDFSLAIDSKNQPHVAFVTEESLKRVLHYAYQTNNGWEFQIVEPFTKTEYTEDRPYLSLKLDSNDTPHLAYEQLVNIDQPSSLSYAVMVNGIWQKETVTQTMPGGHCCNSVMLALDGFNNPHITSEGCCSSDGHASLMYASKTQSGWTFELPVKDLDCWIYQAMDIDVNGNPWIACAKFTNSYDPDVDSIETLHVIWRDRNSWQEKLVYSGRDYGGISIDVDKGGFPHLAFWDISNRDVVYGKLSR